MRSRISGITLLPAALVAATVMAAAAPVAAHEAPPPAPETNAEPAAESDVEKEDCALALKVLSYHKLLPNQPDLGRALCARNQAKQQEQSTQDQPAEDQAAQGGPAEGRPAQTESTKEINSKHTTGNGRIIEENKVLGVPVEWPRNVTVHVPTVNDHWYTYTSKKPG
ncbi:hypothetical protein ETD83_28785 [Actinomadura soli]|uniref:Uncharacterized protein n=1 Tax=Actinomadura soli TaxID=2508997 RepID=A0A5C4J531_9ACTN|nr:hypothetical protein [Actinomadura soli]TMQ91887.1 hypothetical protein ETD83_28785 [Actinomadura soli]